MTTLTARNSAPSRTSLMAVLGLVVTAVLTAVGTFWDVTGNDGKSSKNHYGEYFGTLAIDVALAAVVFGLVVRTAAKGNAGRRAVILGVLAVVSAVVFWSGAPCVLAAGALAAALIERDRTLGWTSAGKAAIALAGLATVAQLVLSIIG